MQNPKMSREQLMTIADEVMDYLGWCEIDLDLIEPLYHQIWYEKYMKDFDIFGLPHETKMSKTSNARSLTFLLL